MKDAYFSLSLSITAHLCVILVLLALPAGNRTALRTIAVDLTLMDGSDGAWSGSHGPRNGTRGREAAGGAGPGLKAGPRPLGSSVFDNSRRPSSMVKSGSTADSPTRAPSPAVDQSASFIPWGEEAGQGRMDGTSPGQGEGDGGKGTGPGFGDRGAGTGTPGGGLQGGSDYHYIREMVMKNVRYPEKARRMGQEGRVVLSFIVVENGNTSDVRIVSSCGFRLLDESAREGVMNTVIPKKVPYRVMVTLPITYRLQ